MKLSAFCIKHKVTTILAFLVIAIFGVVFYTNLKLALMPDMEFPAAYVVSTYVGATPEDIEDLVVRPLESAIATVSGVKSIESTSSENMGMVMITYEDDTDVDQAAVKLREKFSQITLPDGCSDPVIYNINVNDLMPVAVLALSGEDLSQLQTLADQTVVPALERIEGVASASVSGGLTSQIVVETNATLMTGYDLSISTIANYLAASNLIYPGGDVNNGTTTLTVSTDGQYQTVEDVANTLIPLSSGGTIRLSEIATVYMDYSREDSAAQVNGQDCVIIQVNKQSGANEVEVMSRVRESLSDLEEENANLQCQAVYDASEYITQVASNALQNILMGVLLSAVVVFLFLRRPGATVTISLSMPFCVLTVFLIMNVFGISLNMISLGGIALCVGMVVDNSIVVLENIYRYAAEGYSKYDSCVLGAQEVVNSIVASSLTTIAVFLPVGLSGGTAGMMFKDFSLTVVFLIMASLLIALTLVPLMCYFLLDEQAVRLQRLTSQGKASKFKKIQDSLSGKYKALLSFFLRRRFVGLLVSILLVAVFLGSCLTTDMVLVPDMDQGMVSIDVDMPTGTDLDDTIRYGERVLAIVEENCPELDTVYMTVGGGVMGMGSAETASITVNLVDITQRDRSSEEVAKDLQSKLRDIAGCEITASDYSMMGSMLGGSDIEVTVSGTDLDTLQEITNELTAQIAALDDADTVTNSLEQETPAVKVSVNRAAAAQYGLTAATIGSAVRAELTGVTATSVSMDGNDIDVVVKGNGASAGSLDALRSMPIAAPTGGTVPLSSVASVTVELSPQTITRVDQNRQVSITGETISGSSSAINKQIQTILDEYPMPDGYWAEVSGTYSEMLDSFQSLALSLIVAIGLVYFILASQFESFLMPIMVMMILPVALSGALFGLPITGEDISMVVLLGLIMLTGTVVNSSIILVDYINVRRARGQEKNQAILEACPLRVRPILMTTLTTVLAMLPMALGAGEGNEMMKPMGIVMISGMLISTVVTLLFTPVYYSILDSLSSRFTGPFRRRRERKKEKLARKLAEAEAALPSIAEN